MCVWVAVTGCGVDHRIFVALFITPRKDALQPELCQDTPIAFAMLIGRLVLQLYRVKLVCYVFAQRLTPHYKHVLSFFAPTGWPGCLSFYSPKALLTGCSVLCYFRILLLFLHTHHHASPT